MRISFKEILVALAAYGFVTLLFYFPSLSSFPTALIGPPEDNMQFYWFIWHGAKALTDPALPFLKTQFMYYPDGVNLLYANYYYYGIFLAAGLKYFLNAVQIYNLFILHSFILAGIGTYGLLRYLKLGRPESLVGGFIFAFNPSHLAHAQHHVTIASIHWIPFFVWFFIKAMKEEKKLNVFLSSLFLILAALCDWNYLVFGLIFVLASYLYLSLQKKQLWIKPAAHKMSLVVGLSVAVLSPLIIPMIILGAGRSFKMSLPGHNIYVADMLGFFIPHVYHAFSKWGWIAQANAMMTGTDWEKVVYLGIVNLMLVALAFRSIRKTCWKYFLGFIFFMVFSMGVMPHFLGQSVPFPLPYALFEKIPLLSNARNPSRMIVFVYLFLSILVAFAIRELFFTKELNVKRKIFFFAACLFIFLDYFSICRATTPVTLPKAYERIKADMDNHFGILEIPHELGRHLMYQTKHGIPIVQGYIGRRVDDTLGDKLEFNLNRLNIQKRTLIENKVKYIVLFKKKLDYKEKVLEDQLRLNYLEYVARAYAATYEKIYEDDGYAVFRVYA